MIVSVSGTRRITRRPRPGWFSRSIEPPIRSIFDRTTSMPTPRPEMALTWSAVESPGAKMSSSRARSLRPVTSDGLRMRAASARATSFSVSIPRPSSLISIRIWLPDWRAAMLSRPVSGLPTIRRAAGVSMPWSIALRMIWVSGSRIISIISRSSSTLLPEVRRSTCLPRSAHRSRTSRGSGEKMRSIRCIRVWPMASRMSAMQAESRSKAFSSVVPFCSSRRQRATSLRASTMSDTPFIR